jgi:hypothetical protein
MKAAKRAYHYTSLKVSQSFRQMVYGRIGDLNRYQCVIDLGLTHRKEREALSRLRHWMTLEHNFLLDAMNESLKEAP